MGQMHFCDWLMGGMLILRSRFRLDLRVWFEVRTCSRCSVPEPEPESRVEASGLTLDARCEIRIAKAFWHEVVVFAEMWVFFCKLDIAMHVQLDFCVLVVAVLCELLMMGSCSSCVCFTWN